MTSREKGYGQSLEGWKLNTIVTVQSPQPWLMFDGSTHDDFSTGGTRLGDLTDRWDFFGNPSRLQSSSSSIPFCSGFTVNLGGAANSSGATCTVHVWDYRHRHHTPLVTGTQCAAGRRPTPTRLRPSGLLRKGQLGDDSLPRWIPLAPWGGTSSGTRASRMWISPCSRNFKFKERFGAEFRGRVL